MSAAAGRSLKWRLIGAAAVSIAIALAAAGLAIDLMFARHAARRLDAELAGQLNRIAGVVSVGEDGAAVVTGGPADPQFLEPLSGLYWQATAQTGAPARSRSLWDQTLKLPADDLGDGQAHRHVIDGPRPGERLVAHERMLTVEGPDGPRRVRIAVAADEADIRRAVAAFRGDLALSLLALAAALFAAAVAQTQVGLAPLALVRRGVEEVRAGRRARLATEAPREVEPLISEINGLLEGMASDLERSRARAADLAHGLRTPLTVLAADAERLRTQGETALADELTEISGLMRRQVERQLILARASGRAARTRVELRPAVEAILRVARRTPEAQALTWEVRLAEASARIDVDDFNEALGNLVENATKWARGVVRVTLGGVDGGAFVRVEDDGRGVPAQDRDRLLKRGERGDVGGPGGNGLGLSIVEEIVGAAGGRLTLADSALGGLSATLALP
ncbi:MAG: HAMP domain-containing histidine kinase [Rhizobiales bacterium]|nr:HAMP domain-containing histidine kinase [Hyphomicrobiales bacterium]